jgi:hypothetical protein
VDAALLQWFNQKSTEGTSVSGPMCAQKAKFFMKLWDWKVSSMSLLDGLPDSSNDMVFVKSLYRERDLTHDYTETTTCNMQHAALLHAVCCCLMPHATNLWYVAENWMPHIIARLPE